MRYLSVAEISKIWDISERSVRNYCAHGRVSGAFLTGKTWNIPENAEKPERLNKSCERRNLLEVLKQEKDSQAKGGIYHKVQIDLTYNSNHIEGSRLSHDETRYIYETNTIGISMGAGVCTAHAIGAGDDKILSKTVHTAIPTAIICGIIVTAIGFFASGSILRLMDTPEIYLPLSTTYTKIYLFIIFK